jgi:formylglycine-generating enzyme
MRTQSQTTKIGLCVLALWAGAAGRAAADQITDIAMVPRLAIEGTVGATNKIQYCTNLSQPTWLLLTNLVVAATNYWYVDVTAPPAPARYYRVLGPPPNLALIPAGSFTMGDNLDGDPQALPVHTVTVSTFFIEKYEVSKTLWDDVYQWAIAHGYGFEGSVSGKATNHPAYAMTWYEAVKWCNARSEKEGWAPAYYTTAAQTAVYRSGEVDVQNTWVKWNSGYRLPTEAEWERAARGGASGHRYAWSDTDTIQHSRANYKSSTSYAYDTSPTRGYHPTFNDGTWPYTSPVGYFAPNGYGVYDTVGNVWEWCWDWYAAYSSGAQTDPRGPTSGTQRIARGGGWGHDAFYVRTALHWAYEPYMRFGDGGFRCVWSPGP